MVCYCKFKYEYENDRGARFNSNHLEDEQFLGKVAKGRLAEAINPLFRFICWFCIEEV